jgi:hypothetical protein
VGVTTTTIRKARETVDLETVRNHNYTVACLDSRKRTVSFRDIRGNDLEYLESKLGGDDTSITSSDAVEILEYLSTTEGFKPTRLTPATIRSLYRSVSEHILCSYMTKETWLRQCYAVQNGSFQNLDAMESVPLSKFIAMCQIHKEAMDQMNNINNNENTQTAAG